MQATLKATGSSLSPPNKSPTIITTIKLRDLNYRTYWDPVKGGSIRHGIGMDRRFFKGSCSSPRQVFPTVGLHPTVAKASQGTQMCQGAPAPSLLRREELFAPRARPDASDRLERVERLFGEV